MKGKKLIIAGGIFGAAIFGGGVASATTAYYIDYMDRMNPQITSTIDTSYNKQFKDVDSRIYHQTIANAYDEMNKIQKDGNDYLTQKLNEYEQNKMNKNSAAIKARGEQLEADLKSHIDALFPPSN